MWSLLVEQGGVVTVSGAGWSLLVEQGGVVTASGAGWCGHC